MRVTQYLAVKNGYIVLLSAIIISAIVLQFTVFGFQHLIRERQSLAAFQYKQQALFLAHGCMEHVIDTFGRIGTYQGDESYQMDEVACTIEPITSQNGSWTLKTSVSVNFQRASLTVLLTSRAPAAVASWQES